jgi:hypothetical protein
MPDLVIVGKTAGLPRIVAYSQDGVNIGTIPFNGAGIPHFATAGFMLEEAAKQELAHPGTQAQGQGYQEVSFRADASWAIVLVSFDELGTPTLDMSHGIRPSATTLFGLACACRTQAGFSYQQALMASIMQAQQQAQMLAQLSAGSGFRS